MPLLRVEAERLSPDHVLAGVIEEVLTKDEMLAMLPFQKVDGKALVYHREKSLASVDFLDPNDTVNEGAVDFDEVTAKLRILAGDVDVDKFLQETMSNLNNQKAIQIAAKAKAISRKFADTVVNGDVTGDTKSFDGLKKLTVAGQTLTAGANGAALTMSMLDDLADQVPLGADALIMRPGTYRAYLALLRALGGAQPQQVMIENFGMVPAHNGLAILRNEWLPGNEVQGGSSACCSIYAVRFNEADGFHGLFGGDSAGWRIEEIGTVQNKDATRTRVKWYCGAALKSTKAVARLKGVTNI
jgi:hypothetical protein